MPQTPFQLVVINYQHN